MAAWAFSISAWLVVEEKPLWKRLEFVNWDDDIPKKNGQIKNMFQTANQLPSTSPFCPWPSRHPCSPQRWPSECYWGPGSNPHRRPWGQPPAESCDWSPAGLNNRRAKWWLNLLGVVQFILLGMVEIGKSRFFWNLKKMRGWMSSNGHMRLFRWRLNKWRFSFRLGAPA